MQKKDKNKNNKITSPETLHSPEAKAYRLKRVRKIANLSRREIQTKYKLNIETYKGWELGKHGGLSIKGAQKIILALQGEGVNCPLEWLMYGVGPGPQITEFTPSKDSVSYTPIIKNKQEKDKQIQKELEFFLNGHADAIGMIIEDDAMIPMYQTGDYVAGYRYYDKAIRHAVGLDCIIQTIDNKYWIRRLLKSNSKKNEKDKTRNYYTLTSLNHATKIEHPVLHDVELISAAPIIWIRKCQVVT